MAKVSAKYEVVYIVNPTKSEEETAALVAKFTALAEQHASAVEFPAELDRVFGITDGIMRSMIVCRGE